MEWVIILGVLAVIVYIINVISKFIDQLSPTKRGYQKPVNRDSLDLSGKTSPSPAIQYQPEQTASSRNIDVDTSMYRKRGKLMSKSEFSFFHILKDKLPNEYYIFPKMRIADIVETKDGSGYYKQRNKILPKHIDFVICDEKVYPILAIELDGPSHNKPEQQERDELVDLIFKSVKMPLRRVHIGEDFNQVCHELSQKLRN